MTKQQITMHGVAMQIFNYGVILTGNSGVGKSDLALKLLDRKHYFIADDTVNLTNADSSVIIEPIYELGGFLHIKEIGFVDVKASFNKQVFLDKCNLNLIINLTLDNYTNENSLEINRKFFDIYGYRIPYFELNLSNSSRPIELMVELIVKRQQQLDNSYDAHQHFIDMHYNMLNGDKDKCN